MKHNFTSSNKKEYRIEFISDNYENRLYVWIKVSPRPYSSPLWLDETRHQIINNKFKIDYSYEGNYPQDLVGYINRLASLIAFE